MIRANVPTAIELQIRSLLDSASKGCSEQWRENSFSKTMDLLLKAWSLLPEPRLSWDYYPQVISRKILDCYVNLQDVENARKWMSIVREAYDSPSWGEDPAVDFWEAQMNFDLGKEDEALAAFHSLYRKFKKRPFKGRDTKYLDFYFSCKKK